jgi:hypothetical protein
VPYLIDGSLDRIVHLRLSGEPTNPEPEYNSLVWETNKPK